MPFTAKTGLALLTKRNPCNYPTRGHNYDIRWMQHHVLIANHARTGRFVEPDHSRTVITEVGGVANGWNLNLGRLASAAARAASLASRIAAC